ncbi:MAG: ABC transporter ATP-binding protein [Pseudomonadota bacterium]
MPAKVSAPSPVVCNSVSKTFAAGIEAVHSIDLTFAAGHTTALVGPSGCGKSTLLRMIAGLEDPTVGTIDIGGAPPVEILKRAGLSVAFQDPSLLPWRTVRGNIELALSLARQSGNPVAIEELISLVGLAGFENTRPAQLSGGMRQRAAIARALITKPELLLLDEPFGAVDELTRVQLAKDLPRIWEARGTTTILVTHSVSEAVLLSDRVIVLSPRPAGIVADITIDLPRPRSEDSTRGAKATAFIDEIYAALSQGMTRDNPPLAAQ